MLKPGGGNLGVGFFVLVHFFLAAGAQWRLVAPFILAADTPPPARGTRGHVPRPRRSRPSSQTSRPPRSGRAPPNGAGGPEP